MTALRFFIASFSLFVLALLGIANTGERRMTWNAFERTALADVLALALLALMAAWLWTAGAVS